MLNKKTPLKGPQVRPHYNPGFKQAPEDPTRNKINYNDMHLQQYKLKVTEFDFNPVIVTRRNVSTAQTKIRQSQDDEEDLRVTSNFMRKKQTPIHAVNSNQGLADTKRATDRPKSKQEPRRNGWNNNNAPMLKSTVIENERPQTSKGQRPRPMDKSMLSQIPKRKISQGCELNKNQSTGQAYQHQPKGSQTTRVGFKTAIDADFLSLFAS